MEKILFVKYSNERDKRFAIRTELRVDEHGEKRIYKFPFEEAGSKHVQNIYKYYNQLSDRYSDSGISINKCVSIEDGIEFEYIEGMTLQEKFDELIENKEYSQIERLIDEVVRRISVGAYNDFVMTDEFIEVFGEYPELLEQKGMKSANITDIDMILSNYIVNENWTLIDYEWTFDFPVPNNFVIYRMLFYLIHQSFYCEQLELSKLLARYNISSEEIDIYMIMERHFQSYIKGNQESIREIGTSDLSNINTINDINNLLYNIPFKIMLSLVEQDKNGKNKILDNRNLTIAQYYHYKMDDLSNTDRIYMEVKNACLLAIFEDDSIVDKCNGMKLADGIYIFITDFAQIYFKIDNQLDIKVRMVPLQIEEANRIKQNIDEKINVIAGYETMVNELRKQLEESEKKIFHFPRR